MPYSLSRKRIRASFNKYNVYNALTWRKNRPLSTQYRQIFFAKQESRAYHGDRLTENQFKNHFRGDLPVVSPLQSSRKSGDGSLDIPYALQTFVGLERRLDFAVFRSLLASSVRQAAYCILRGSVKVNGVRIKSPGYILRPGDMFSVDPRRVLFALGRPKPSKAESIETTNRIIKKFNAYIDKCHSHPQRMWKLRQKHRKRHRVYNAKYESRREKRVELHNKEVLKKMQQALEAVKPVGVLERVLKGQFTPQPKVVGVVKEIQRLTSLSLESKSSGEAFTEVQVLDEKDANKLASTYYGDGEAPPHRSDVKHLVKQVVDSELDSITASYQLQLSKLDEDPYDPDWLARLPPKVELLKEDEIEDVSAVKIPLPFSTTGGKLYGLSEPSKTWFTPWSPRQFISPFAILPHHIEVDFQTCHAVYLRDPVARPGHSEVISPFNLDMHERAYLWYIYRRRKQLPSLD